MVMKVGFINPTLTFMSDELFMLPPLINYERVLDTAIDLTADTAYVYEPNGNKALISRFWTISALNRPMRLLRQHSDDEYKVINFQVNVDPLARKITLIEMTLEKIK